jgi:hypothetical protein
MYKDYLWLILLCGSGIVACITYVVCLLSFESKRKKSDGKTGSSKETLVINLDD